MYAGLALAALLSSYAVTGCSKKETPTQQPQKSATSRSIEQRTVETRREVSDQELMELYKKSVEKSRPFYQKIDEALTGFAKRSGYQGIEDITEQDYNGIVGSIIKEMRQDPEIKPLYEKPDTRRRIAQLANQNMDINNVRRANQILYFQGKQRAPVFLDAELTMPFGEEDLAALGVVIVKNPRAYKNSNGEEAVEIQDGMWMNMKYFGNKPGEYARKKLEDELKELQSMHSGLNEFLKKAKPITNTEDLQKLLEKESEKVANAVYKVRRPSGEGGPQDMYYTQLVEADFSVDGLQEGKKSLEKAIADLNKVLGSK